MPSGTPRPSTGVGLPSRVQVIRGPRRVKCGVSSGPPHRPPPVGRGGRTVRGPPPAHRRPRRTGGDGRSARPGPRDSGTQALGLRGGADAGRHPRGRRGHCGAIAWPSWGGVWGSAARVHGVGRSVWVGARPPGHRRRHYTPPPPPPPHVRPCAPPPPPPPLFRRPPNPRWTPPGRPPRGWGGPATGAACCSRRWSHPRGKPWPGART